MIDPCLVFYQTSPSEGDASVSKLLRKWLSVVALLIVATVAMRLTLGAARTHAISIKSMQFSPATVSINVGDTITWSNQDDRDHKIVAEDGSFQSGNLSAGATYTHTFPRPGECRYGCTYHPREKGVIVVGK
jgi:plastocyanin